MESPIAKAVFCDVNALGAAVPAPAPAPKLPSDFLPVPLVRQATPYSCGAAALLSVLFYWQVHDGGESSLYERLQTTPKDGTEPPKLAEGARSFGLEARVQEGSSWEDLSAAFKRGETAILGLQAWRTEETKKLAWKEDWDDGHYSVLVALDENYAYFMDPSSSGVYAYIPREELLDRWHDFEDRRGVRREYRNLAIFIKGKNPLKALPGPLLRME